MMMLNLWGNSIKKNINRLIKKKKGGIYFFFVNQFDLLEEDVFKLYREKGQLKTMGLVAGMGVLAAHLSQSKNNPYGIRNTDYVYVHESGTGWRDDLNADNVGGWGVE